MALTGAERQKRYRENRKLAGENGYRQINTWISTDAALALKRLARCYGVTQRELIERLLLKEQDMIMRGLSSDNELDEYLLIRPEYV
jgi:hypothetical protein